MRRTLIAGNWKMNLLPEEASKLVSELVKIKEGNAEMLICPPFVDIPAAASLLKDSFIKLGAQNVYPEEKGAFTGEISPDMLKALGCSYVICGHSERRFILGETNEFISRKVKSVFSHGMIPVLCVGEHLKDREEGRTEEVISEEIETALWNISKDEVNRLVIAYEPVWAIGSGKAATTSDAEEVASFIRRKVKDLFGEEAASHVRILYGGSVKAENIDGFLKEEDIDGALIGGASLKADSFKAIYDKA